MVKAITEQDITAVANFYDQRFLSQGENIQSVGWRDQQSQYLRFDYLLMNYDASGKTILDLGCGFADLYHYLFDKYGNRFNYIGIDTSIELLNVAQQRCHSHNSQFFHGDLASWLAQSNAPNVDFALESGMLSFKISDNNAYAEQIMRQLFQLSKDGIAMNFLSDQVDFQLDKNHHFNAEQVLNWAKKHTRHWNLYQDYPLWEFTIQLYKSAKTLRGLS